MHGIRYLSIVTPKFIKIALALTWLVPLVLSTAAFVWFHVSLLTCNPKIHSLQLFLQSFETRSTLLNWNLTISLSTLRLCFQQQADDPECFLGHTEPKVTVIIILSAILIILLFTYLAYGRICLEALALQKRRKNTQNTTTANFPLQRISRQKCGSNSSEGTSFKARFARFEVWTINKMRLFSRFFNNVNHSFFSEVKSKSFRKITKRSVCNGGQHHQPRFAVEETSCTK